jgi:hypothetical protein
MKQARALASMLILGGGLIWATALASDFSHKFRPDQDEEETGRQTAPPTPPPTTVPAPARLANIPTRPPALSNSERPLVAAAGTYYAMLYERRFDEIDRAADQARANDTTLPDGQPLLGAIYDGVAGCFCGVRQTPATWAQRRALLAEWRRRSPGSVTAEVASIAVRMAYAWSLRSQASNNSAQESRSMEAFGNEAGAAYRMLETASPAARTDPGGYYIRLHIGLALGWPKSSVGATFKEATARYPLYLPLYFAAADYFNQRWYGSIEEERQFLDEAVAATRPRLGETLYARIPWAEQTDEGIFLRKEADWERMRAGFERIIADYPDNWNLNNYMRYACIAEDHATVLRLGPRIKKPLMEAWQGRGSNLTVDFCLKVAQQALKR